MDVPPKLKDIFRQANSPADYFQKYTRNLGVYLEGLDWQAVADATECFLAAGKRGATIFFVGNGGSAATASHFASDLARRARWYNRPGFRAVSLTDNIALMTALANDEGYETIFTGQMQDLFSEGDVLVAISASGDSPNVIAAAKLAKQRRGTTVALVGFDGGTLRNLCDIVVHVRSEKGEYGPVEDIHMVLDHMITSYLWMRLRDEDE